MAGTIREKESAAEHAERVHVQRSTNDGSKVIDLPVEAARAAYLWNNYYAGEAAVGEITGTTNDRDMLVCN